jgi:hypothetical protein
LCANIAAQALMSLVPSTAEQLVGMSNGWNAVHFGEVFSDLPKRFATPLTSIMARTQQLIDKSDSPDRQQPNLAIIECNRRMMKMCGRFKTSDQSLLKRATSVSTYRASTCGCFRYRL